MTDIPALIRSLTPAQKRAVMWMRDDGEWKEHESATVRAVQALMRCQMGMVNETVRKGNRRYFYRLTPLGLEVRRALEKETQP